MKLTRTTVDAAQPGSRTRTHWDDALKGFGLQVTAKGVKSFVVRYRVGGGRRSTERRKTLGRYGTLTPEEARTRAKEILSRARLGQDPLAEERAKRAEMTVGEFIELWAVDAAPINRRTGRPRKSASVAHDIRQMRTHVVARLGNKRLGELQKADLDGLRTAIRSRDTQYNKKTKPRGVQRVRGGDGTAIRVLAVLKSALAWAEDQGLVEWSPARKLKLPQAKKQNYQPLSRQQFGKLGAALQAMHEEYRDAVEIILLIAILGARKSEIERLMWCEVRPDYETLCLRNAKTDERMIYLGPCAGRILASRPRQQNSPYVFPATRGDSYYQDMPKVWRLVLRRAGLPETITRKDLRHSFATYGAETGIASAHMQRLMGHTNLGTTEIYYHIRDAGVREAAKQMDAAICDLMGLEPPPLAERPLVGERAL